MAFPAGHLLQSLYTLSSHQQTAGRCNDDFALCGWLDALLRILTVSLLT